MKILLIGPGCKPIPPTGWGAVESVVWDYYENLSKLNQEVKIINNSDIQYIIQRCNEEKPDVIHIMYDDWIIIVPYLQCKKIYYTSHYAYLTNENFGPQYQYYFLKIFQQVIKNQDKITIHSISPKITEVYRKFGFQGEIKNIGNGAREDLFRYTTTPHKRSSSIYIAKIEERKSQYKYQGLPDIHFVGNYHNSPFNKENPNYLGEWSKETN